MKCRIPKFGTVTLAQIAADTSQSIPEVRASVKELLAMRMMSIKGNPNVDKLGENEPFECKIKQF